MLFHADSEESDQTGRMLSLRCRTCHFVGFVMLRLTCVVDMKVKSGKKYYISQ